MGHGTQQSHSSQVKPNIFLVAIFSAFFCSIVNAQGELDEAEIFFELNSTDGDLGIQAFLDGDPWRNIDITAPYGQKVFSVRGRGHLKNLGLSELFFESEEPELQALSFAELLLLFPEGEYQFKGKTVDEMKLSETAELTADIPCPPTVLSPVEDEEVPIDELTIEWMPESGVFDPDTYTCWGVKNVELTGFQVIVEFENEDEELMRVYSVDMSPDATKLTVPPEFLQEGVDFEDTEFKVEVLAIEESGNKTITEVGFEVGD